MTSNPNSDSKANMPFSGANFNHLTGQPLLPNIGGIPSNSMPSHFGVPGGMDADALNYPYYQVNCFT